MTPGVRDDSGRCECCGLLWCLCHHGCEVTALDRAIGTFIAKPSAENEAAIEALR